MRSDSYDRDGVLIPDDWYDKNKYGDKFLDKWRTAQRVGRTRIGDRFTVSTVWLSIDHRFGDGPPLIFETMVFGEPYDQELQRYSSEEEAMRGHLAVVERLRSGQQPFEEQR